MSVRVDLQQVLALAEQYEASISSSRQRQVCAHLRDCRTPALGGLRQHCGRCD